MSDLDTSTRHRRSYQTDDKPRERKHRRSRSRSTDRHDQHKKRPKSPQEAAHERSNHDRIDSHTNHRSRRVDNISDSERQNSQRRRRRRRSRSQNSSTRHHRRRSPSEEATTNTSHKDNDRKQLTRTRHGPESSRSKHRKRARSSSRSPPRKSHRRNSPPSPPSTTRRIRGPLPSQQDAFTSTYSGGGRGGAGGGDIAAPLQKLKPNYATSGKLAAETNTISIGGEAILLKYHEPPEARKPPAAQAWRMYEFKGEAAEPLSTVELGVRSCWLFGRESAVVDFLIEHPSCSKQHAVIQFRYVEKRGEFGEKMGAVKPYLLDLESANGTVVNGEKVPDRRYVELKSGDSVGFGESSREYVILLPPREKVVAE